MKQNFNRLLIKSPLVGGYGNLHSVVAEKKKTFKLNLEAAESELIWGLQQQGPSLLEGSLLLSTWTAARQPLSS